MILPTTVLCGITIYCTSVCVINTIINVIFIWLYFWVNQLFSKKLNKKKDSSIFTHTFAISGTLILPLDLSFHLLHFSSA